MGIDMSNYKMIYKDQVFNVINIMMTTEFLSNIAEEQEVKVTNIEATYIDENGEIKIIRDEATMFKFVRR